MFAHDTHYRHRQIAVYLFQIVTNSKFVVNRRIKLPGPAVVGLAQGVVADII